MGLECLFPPTASSSSMNSTQGLWARAVSAGGVAGSEYTHRACGRRAQAVSAGGVAGSEYTHRACGHRQSLHGQCLQGEWQGQSTHTGLVGMGSLCRGSGRVRVHTQGLWAWVVSAGEWQSQLTHTSGNSQQLYKHNIITQHNYTNTT